jgi:hypothetical protein
MFVLVETAADHLDDLLRRKVVELILLQRRKHTNETDI